MVRLSKREREVFELFAVGLTDREAGIKLRLEEAQVTLIWQGIANKLQALKPKTFEGWEQLLSYERIERKRLELEVWAGEARLNALMDTAQEAVFLIEGHTGRILKANNNAVLMFGYSPRELIGMIMEQLLPGAKRGIHELYRTGFLSSVRKREIGYHPPIFALRKDGKRIRLDIALTASQATADVMVMCQKVEVNAEQPDEENADLSERP